MGHANNAEQIEVGSGPLDPDDVVRVARQGVGVRLADYALAAIAASRDIVEGLAKDDRPRYGVSTGFGPDFYHQSGGGSAVAL
jgi:histidine ammonia-lyase